MRKTFYGGWIFASVAIGLATTQQLDAAPLYSQGFETNTDGWIAGSGSITRVASGTDGITSSSGAFHAIVKQISGGPHSFFDGNSPNAWLGGFTVSTDIYLDTSWDLGEGFDYSTAIYDSSGDHQQDFIFHVTKDTSTGNLLVGGSNNTNFDPREDLETINSAAVSTGWYTFEHVFREQAGDLFGDLNLRDSSGTLLFTETRTGGDPIATTGGVGYSWFTNIDIDGGIAIDNHSLSVSAVPEPSSLALFGIGACATGLGAARRRRREKQQNVAA